MMFFPSVISLSILSSILPVYAYLNDTSSSNTNLTWSGNSAHPLSSNSSQWCYFPVANVTTNTACIGTSSSSASNYQTLIYTHLNQPQGWSIAYYAVDNLTLLGDFTYPVPPEGARLCLSGQALDNSYQTYCDRVLDDNDLGNNASDWCVVALGQSYVSDGCYTVTSASGTVSLSAVTVPATTVTTAQPAATSGQSKAKLLQECIPGCRKSQCTFSNLSHSVELVTYSTDVGTPVENCEPNSNTNISTVIGGSVQITDTWSVTTSLGVSFAGLDVKAEGSFSSSKAIMFSQTIAIQIPPGQMGTMVANVLYNQTSGNMKIGSNALFPITSNQPLDVVSYGQRINPCGNPTNSSPIACTLSAAVSLRENSLMTFFGLLIPVFALMV